MQPEVSNTSVGSERAPSTPEQNMDRLPVLPAPEMGGIETGAERKEQASELKQVVADAAATAVPIDPSLAGQPTAASDPGSTNPLTAAHEDLIEKEWVNKAKQIISDTKEDPFKREQQVSELQKDYLRKRYGKELGAA